MEIVNGPVAPGGSDLIYQVTLASGAIVTNPEAFLAQRETDDSQRLLMTEDGQLLAVPLDEHTEDVREPEAFGRARQRGGHR